MLYKEKAIYSNNGTRVSVEVLKNGEFKIYNSKKTFQSGNLKKYYVSNNGYGNNRGVYVWRKFRNPRRVTDELLFYEKPIADPKGAPYAKHKSKKKKFLEVTKQFGCRSFIKIPGLFVVLFYTLFIGFIAYGILVLGL